MTKMKDLEEKISSIETKLNYVLEKKGMAFREKPVQANYSYMIHKVPLRYSKEADYPKYKDCEHEFKWIGTMTFECNKCGCLKSTECSIGQMRLGGGMSDGFELIFLKHKEEYKYKDYINKAHKQYGIENNLMGAK